MDTPAHAKNRPPSAAKRWLACPFSATVAPLYPRDDTVASNKGDMWHALMETLITFGTLPLDCDPDAAEELEVLNDYVKKRFKEAGANAAIYVEQRLDIPDTGEFGTADIIIVGDDLLEIADEKSGYIVVEADHNAQMLVYLTGAIAKYGKRPKYRLTIHQPNYDHIDGPLRYWEPTDLDIDHIHQEIIASMLHPDKVLAGPHCKATYCEHRGACEAFRAYAQEDLSLGWHSSELKSMDDLKLAKALEASDELGGWRTELRSEAVRRIMNMNRTIPGYKVVKGRRSRTVLDPLKLIQNVCGHMGIEWARKMLPDLAWVPDLNPTLPDALKCIGTPKHIEDVIKQYARQHKAARGEWKQLYDLVVGEYIRETASGLTLEKAIDGRPAHRRGSEFGVINSSGEPTVL